MVVAHIQKFDRMFIRMEATITFIFWTILIIAWFPHIYLSSPSFIISLPPLFLLLLGFAGTFFISIIFPLVIVTSGGYSKPVGEGFEEFYELLKCIHFRYFLFYIIFFIHITLFYLFYFIVIIYLSILVCLYSILIILSSLSLFSRYHSSLILIFLLLYIYRNVFHEYLVAQFAEENLQLYEVVEEWKDLKPGPFKDEKANLIAEKVNK